MTAINYDSGGTGTTGTAGAPGTVQPSDTSTVGTYTYFLAVTDSKGTSQKYGPLNYMVACGSTTIITSSITGTDPIEFKQGATA